MRNETLSEKKLSADDVLQMYIDIARADIGDYVERGDGGYSIAIKPLDQMDTSIISELSNTENGIKMKLADKMKAMEMLAKYTDLLSDNDKKRLQEEKLKVEIEKVKVETKSEKSDGGNKTVIITGEDEMRRVLEAKKARDENDDG